MQRNSRKIIDNETVELAMLKNRVDDLPTEYENRYISRPSEYTFFQVYLFKDCF